MGRHQPGSDLDLCLEAAQLRHSDRLRVMAAVDDLLLRISPEQRIGKQARSIWHS